ncbi:MAG: hypothetical protein C0507_12385 [Cyanobacteria bacterium PR.3.49]|nr:hypothetical protein [Cyanobacteria bacterium PR.3.49]
MSLQEPTKFKPEELKVVADENLRSEIVKPETTCFDGGSTPPPVSRKNSDGLWLLLSFGAILIGLGAFILSHDPAAATYRQHSLSIAGFRVSCELIVLWIGCGCAFTAAILLWARFKAGKLERISAGRVKNMQAKRLEKVSDGDVFSIIASYVGRLFGQL